MAERSAKDVFAEVLELAPTARAAALTDLCGGNEALHRDVRELLALHDSAPGFLGDPTFADSGTTGEARRGEGVGTVISGKYKLLEMVGEGGFGEVFMAEQREPIRRLVALKIIKLGMDTKQVVARFEHERQAIAMMDHPNIAKVFDAGATDTGRPFFVMELVRGVPITKFCDQQRLTTRERLDLLVDVCRAVQHAHQKGIIHRDIKPNNILVTLHDSVAVPKVIDFGIAKATSARLTEKTLFTEMRQFVGTPTYMSPEQAELSGLDIDTRCDVYSLGVLLYELMTGTTPFSDGELLEKGFAEIQRVIREVEPPRPSTRVSSRRDTLPSVAALRRIEPAHLPAILRGELDWIVMKCLEKDRRRRYHTADALCADLLAHAEGREVSAVPPSAGYRARKFVARHRGLMLAGAAVLCVLLLGMAGTTWGLFGARRAERVAQKERDGAQASRDFLTRTFEGVAPQVARGRNTELLGALMDDAIARIDAGELAGNAQAETELRIEIAEVYFQIARYADARRAVAPLSEGVSLPSLTQVRLLLLRAELALTDSQVDAMQGFLDRAQRLLDAEPEPDPRLRLALLSGLASVALEKNQVAQSVELERQAVEAARALPLPNGEVIARRLLNLGVALNRQEHEDEAFEAWAESLRELEHAHDGAPGSLDSPTKVDVLVKRAVVHAQRMRLDLAKVDLDEAIRIGERMFPPNHPTLFDIHYALSNVHLHAGRYDEALAEFNVILASKREVYGRESLAVAGTLDAVAKVHSMAGRWEQSLEVGTEMERIRAIHLSPEASAALGGWTSVADCLRRLGRTEEALSLARRSVTLQRRTLQPESEEGLVGFATFTQCLYAANRIDEAAEQGRAFLKLCAERRPHDPPVSLPEIQALTALALLDNGDPRNMAESEQLLRACIDRHVRKTGGRDARGAALRLYLGRAIAAQVLAGADASVAGGAAPGQAPDIDRIREAASLLGSNFQSLVDNIWRLDESIRVRRVREAAGSLIDLYEWWDRLEPGTRKSAMAQEWRERRDAALKSMESGLSPAPHG